MRGGRRFAVDYSGRCGAPAMFVIVDKVSGSKGPLNWQMLAQTGLTYKSTQEVGMKQPNSGPVKEIRSDTGRQTFTLLDAKKHLAWAAILAWTLGFVPANARSEDTRKLDGVKYLPKGRAETMWLRIPAEAGPDKRLPAILIIPGGGWGNHFGGKYVATAEQLAGWGYVVAVIDYQIVSEQARGVSYLRNMSDSFPQCLHDCKTAVRFLRHNAEKYGINPEKIGVLGSSAGGHLAAMTAVTQAKDGLEPASDGLGAVSSAVQACVSYYGAHDWSTWGFKRGSALSDDDKQDQSRGSTVQWVDKDDPPMLVIHGDKDKTVPVAQSQALAAKLKEVGARFEYWEVPGAGHGTCLNGKIKGEEDRLKAFLERHLKGAKQ